MKIRNFLVLIFMIVWVVLIICENVGAINVYAFVNDEVSNEELAMAYVEDTYDEGNYEIFVCGFSNESQITFVVTQNGEFVNRESVSRDYLMDTYNA